MAEPLEMSAVVDVLTPIGLSASPLEDLAAFEDEHPGHSWCRCLPFVELLWSADRVAKMKFRPRDVVHVIMPDLVHVVEDCAPYCPTPPAEAIQRLRDIGEELARRKEDDRG